MTPLFHEDSLGALLAEKLAARRTATEPEGASHRASVMASVDTHAEDADLLDDPRALAEAELAVASDGPYEDAAAPSEWVTVFGPAKISGFFDAAGPSEYVFSAPLAGADIPFRWEPYAPSLMPCYRPGDGGVDRPFSLSVPKGFESAARAALADLKVESTAWSQFGLPLHAERTDEATTAHVEMRWLVVVVLLLPDVMAFVYSALAGVLDILRYGGGS